MAVYLVCEERIEEGVNVADLSPVDGSQQWTVPCMLVPLESLSVNVLLERVVPRTGLLNVTFIDAVGMALIESADGWVLMIVNGVDEILDGGCAIILAEFGLTVISTVDGVLFNLPSLTTS